MLGFSTFCWLNSNPKAYHSWKNSVGFFICICPNREFFSCQRQEKESAILDILMTITLEVNMITRQIILFFHLPFEQYPLLYLLFAFQDLKNYISWRSPFALCSGMKNRFHAEDHILKFVSVDILFLHKRKVANFWYIPCFVPNLIPISQ